MALYVKIMINVCFIYMFRNEIELYLNWLLKLCFLFALKLCSKCNLIKED